MIQAMIVIALLDQVSRCDAEIARLTAALEDERGMVEGKSRYERVAAKYRNALEERDTARAEVAMALEVAASVIGDNMRHAAELGREIWPIPDIRALTPAHATEALAADRKAKVKEGAGLIIEALKSDDPNLTGLLVSQAGVAIDDFVEAVLGHVNEARAQALREAMAACLDPDDRSFILALIEKEGGNG